MRSKIFILMTCFLATALAGCDSTTNYLKSDREASLEIQDYKDAFASRLSSADDNRPNAGASGLELQPYIAEGVQEMETYPIVSISVNQSVPLRDILFELAEQAKYDVELDPRIRGSIIFTARERPLDQVVERIANVAGLRYSFNDEVLRIELDTPFNKTYKVDYLNYIRTNSSSISNDISVVSGDGTDSGSDFEASAQSEANFWGELEANLTQILGASGGALRTNNDPQILTEEQNPDVQPVAPLDDNGNVQVQPPEAVLRVESLPVDSGGEDEVEASGASFSVNRQAGLVNVLATEKLQKEISEYLKILEKSVTAQVLIEAKILEVTLSDEHDTGINWDFVGLNDGDFSFDFNAPSSAASGFFTASFSGSNDFNALVSAVSQFGTVRALASPRMTVLNNQSAVLNVATNRVFFELDIEVTTEDSVTQTTVDSDIQNVPEGVLVNVQPSINLENRTISMAVRPTVTSIGGNVVEDPGVAIAVGQCGAACAGITSEVPELNVQEIDSIIKMNSGQPIVMGGLLQDTISTTESGIPVIGEVPVIGRLFKNHGDIVQKTELVIFLKATILDSPGDSVHSTDKDLYRRFSSDRRPLRF